MFKMFWILLFKYVEPHRADLMKKVHGMYIHSMETIYLSRSAQVAEGTVFRKSPFSEVDVFKFPIRRFLNFYNSFSSSSK